MAAGMASWKLMRRIKLDKCLVQLSRRCTNVSSRQNFLVYDDRDPAPLFFSSKVQELLKRITGLNLNKIFSTKQMEPTDPTYQFATAEEFEKMINEAKEKAQKQLQMPPVLQQRKPIDEVISRDPELKGFETSTMIFTDITYGISDRQRIIVARDPDGILRKASWEERHRMNQIYFPVAERKLRTPRMFEDEHLQKVLNEREYEFILDRACLQFEPDDPNYIRVTTKTYDHIDSKRSYYDLHSTRHFGPMTFFLVFCKKMDHLLLEMINRELINDAVDLIELFYLMHPDAKASQAESANHIEFIKGYSESSLQRTNIQFALHAYQNLQQQKLETLEGIRKSHGFSE